MAKEQLWDLEEFKEMPDYTKAAAQAVADFSKKASDFTHHMSHANAALRAGKIDMGQHKALVAELSKGYGTSVAQIDKFNKTVNISNLSMRALSESILNAALKVGLWMVATTTIIGAIRKVQQSLQVWKDIEIGLERIGITTQKLGDELYKYFESAADVAIRMGMPIQQVMTGMNLALRATASLESGAKRAAVAHLMLRDAAILGNLAGMQFDQAINVLVGSLRQTGMGLHEGISLLDRWVAVSRNAGVSINDLAQGFAVMGAAAESAGVNVDQINGLIAALSESVTLGPTEIGNAIRALMSTLYNPESVKILQSFGIAARDATGEFRSFWSIMNELSAMEVTGALSDSQILEISRAAGAGQRRYAQFQAILKNWNTAVRVSEVSSNAFGEALSANERIVDTLTNAFDQMNAAQSKMIYAFGQSSGVIQDLTWIMQTLAGVFDFMSNQDEVVARLTKAVIALTASVVILKFTLMGFERIKPFFAMMPFIGAFGSGIKNLGLQLKALGPAMLGLKAGVVSMPEEFKSVQRNVGVQRGTSLIAPVGGYTDPLTQKHWRGGQVTGITAMGSTRGELTKGAWSDVGSTMKTQASAFGKALVQPIKGVGVAFGAAAAFAIHRELHKSNWAGIGGAIGAMAGAKFGIVGMAVGSTIGGLIAKEIEYATKTFEQRVAVEYEKLLRKIDPDIAGALTGLSETFDVTGLTTKPFEDGATAAERMREQIDDLTSSIEFLSAMLDTPKIPWWISPGAAWQRMKIESNLGASEVLKVGTERALRVLNENKQEALSLDYEIASRAQKLIDLLGTQEQVESRINDIKSRALDMTQEEIEQEISHARSADITYRRIVAQLERHTPDLVGVFKGMFPSYEDFVDIKPDAYAPLISALSAATSSYIAMDEAQSKIVIGARYLGALIKDASGEYIGTENTLENMTEHYAFWNRLQQGILSDNAAAWEELIGYAEQLNSTGKNDEETRSKSAAALGVMLMHLDSAVQAYHTLNEEQGKYDESIEVTLGRIKSITDYIQPGKLEFLAPDIDPSKIQPALDKYYKMFKPFLTGKPTTFHTFQRDDEGRVTGYLETFETYPEIWSAMLQELNAIEGNTAKMLEAEYNLPGWYHTPTRYWAIKETGMKEGFGPAQETLWAQWKAFLSGLTTAKLEVDTENAEQAVNNLCDTIEATANRTGEYIEGFDWSPWQFMAEASKEAGFADTADESLKEKTSNAVEGVWKSFTDAVVKFFKLDEPLLDIGVFKIPSFEDVANAIFTEAYNVFPKIIHWLLGGEDVEAAAQQTGNSFDKLSGNIDETSSSSSVMSSSLYTVSSNLRATTAGIYNFSNSLTYLLNSLDSDIGGGGGGGGGGNGGNLPMPMQQGGVIPATGTYYLHKNEVVNSVSDIKNTNALLSNSYRALLISQNYLSAINVGIIGLKQEIRGLRSDMSKGIYRYGGEEFSTQAKTGYTERTMFLR